MNKGVLQVLFFLRIVLSCKPHKTVFEQVQPEEKLHLRGSSHVQRSIQAFMWIFEEAKNICMKYSKDNLRLEWFLFRKLYDKDIGGKLLKTGTISDFCCILTPSLMGSALVRRT